MKKSFLTIFLTLVILSASGCCPTRQVVVYEPTPMPPAKVEIMTLRPCPKAVWVPGHWVWKGRNRGWVWISGHWR